MEVGISFVFFCGGFFSTMFKNTIHTFDYQCHGPHAKTFKHIGDLDVLASILSAQHSRIYLVPFILTMHVDKQLIYHLVIGIALCGCTCQALLGIHSNNGQFPAAVDMTLSLWCITVKSHKYTQCAEIGLLGYIFQVTLINAALVHVHLIDQSVRLQNNFVTGITKSGRTQMQVSLPHSSRSQLRKSVFVQRKRLIFQKKCTILLP